MEPGHEGYLSQQDRQPAKRPGGQQRHHHRYYGAKDSFKNYLTGPFYIKIDAETIRVDSHVPNTTDPAKVGEGVLIVARGQNNTTAAAHPYGSALMIYNNTGLGIDESTPEISLFSSTQHVIETTGDVDPTWTESRYIGNTKNCWRYKRVYPHPGGPRSPVRRDHGEEQDAQNSRHDPRHR